MAQYSKIEAAHLDTAMSYASGVSDSALGTLVLSTKHRITANESLLEGLRREWRADSNANIRRDCEEKAAMLKADNSDLRWSLDIYEAQYRYRKGNTQPWIALRMKVVGIGVTRVCHDTTDPEHFEDGKCDRPGRGVL